LGSVQPPTYRVQRALSAGLSGRGVNVTTYMHLTPRLQISGCNFTLLYTFMACKGRIFS